MPTVECNGATLYYEDRGRGQPIVFLHGAFVGLRYFEPQLAGLSEAYRTVAFDFRGHGRSETTERGHTLPQHARDLQVVLDRLDLDDVVLVGWSMGALVSWEYVDQFGTDRIRALVDVDMEPSPFQRAGYEYGTYTLDGLRETLAEIQADPWGLTERSIDSLLKSPPTAEIRNMMFDEGTRTPPSIQAGMLLELLRDYRDVLPTIDVPTLVCVGMDEKWRSAASVEYAAELLPNATVERFEDSGHCPPIEEPERFNRVLTEFVYSLPPAP